MGEPVAWREGYPPFPQDQEWFIAETTYGDRVVLRSLDEGREHKGNYAFKTADETHMKAEVVRKWMQFPDCEYLPPAARPAQPAAPAAADEIANLRAALKWYADGEHFTKAQPDAWDTVSGEPLNWWCDEAGTATVEDGTLAGMVLAGKLTGAQLHAPEADGPQNDVQAAFGGLVQTPQG